MTARPEAFGVLLKLGPADVVRFAPSGNTLAITTPTEVRLWDIAGREVASAAALRDVTGLDFSPTGELLAAIDSRGGVTTLSADGLRQQWSQRTSGFGEGPGPLFGPDGTHIVYGSWNGDLVARHVGGDVVFHEADDGRMISAVACDAERRLFAYALSTQNEIAVRVRTWPFEKHDARDVFHLRSRNAPEVVALAVDGSGRVAIRQRPQLSVVNAETGEMIATRAMTGSGIEESLAWAPDGRLAATDANARTGKRVLELSSDLQLECSLEVARASSVDYSRSGEYLAVGSWDCGRVFERRH